MLFAAVAKQLPPPSEDRLEDVDKGLGKRSEIFRNVLKYLELAVDLGKAVPVFGVVCTVVGEIVKVGNKIVKTATHVKDTIHQTCVAIEELDKMKKKMQEEGFHDLESMPWKNLEKCVGNSRKRSQWCAGKSESKKPW